MSQAAEKKTEGRFPKITEQGLDELRQRIGVPITDTLEPWNYEATRDAIRHYAHGIGDDNPLWTDPAYAAKTKYGSIVSLPSFLFSTSRIVSGYCGGLSGVPESLIGLPTTSIGSSESGRAILSSISWLATCGSATRSSGVKQGPAARPWAASSLAASSLPRDAAQRSTAGRT